MDADTGGKMRLFCVPILKGIYLINVFDDLLEGSYWKKFGLFNIMYDHCLHFAVGMNITMKRYFSLGHILGDQILNQYNKQTQLLVIY